MKVFYISIVILFSFASFRFSNEINKPVFTANQIYVHKLDLEINYNLEPPGSYDEINCKAKLLLLVQLINNKSIINEKRMNKPANALNEIILFHHNFTN